MTVFMIVALVVIVVAMVSMIMIAVLVSAMIVVTVLVRCMVMLAVFVIYMLVRFFLRSLHAMRVHVDCQALALAARVQFDPGKLLERFDRAIQQGLLLGIDRGVLEADQVVGRNIQLQPQNRLVERQIAGRFAVNMRIMLAHRLVELRRQQARQADDQKTEHESFHLRSLRYREG